MAFQEGFNPFGGIIKSSGNSSGGGSESTTHMLSVSFSKAEQQRNDAIFVMADGEEMQLNEGTIQVGPFDPFQVMQCNVPTGSFVLVRSIDNNLNVIEESYIEALDVPSSIITTMDLETDNGLPLLPNSFEGHDIYFTMPNYDTFVDVAFVYDD